MSVTTRFVDCPLPEVFALFMNARAYPRWVVGAKAFRGVDEEWPQPGSTFHHRVGFGPFVIDDQTKLLAVEPPGRVVLEAHAWPAGSAVVELTLRALDDRTEITMQETPSRGIAVAIDNRVLRKLTALRNRWGLARVDRILRHRPDLSNGPESSEERA